MFLKVKSTAMKGRDTRHVPRCRQLAIWWLTLLRDCTYFLSAVVVHALMSDSAPSGPSMAVRGWKPLSELRTEVSGILLGRLKAVLISRYCKEFQKPPGGIQSYLDSCQPWGIVGLCVIKTCFFFSQVWHFKGCRYKRWKKWNGLRCVTYFKTKNVCRRN